MIMEKNKKIFHWSRKDLSHIWLNQDQSQRGRHIIFKVKSRDTFKNENSNFKASPGLKDDLEIDNQRISCIAEQWWEETCICLVFSLLSFSFFKLQFWLHMEPEKRSHKEHCVHSFRTVLEINYASPTYQTNVGASSQKLLQHPSDTWCF